MTRLDQSVVAERAGVSAETIKRLEKMDGPLMATKTATLYALEQVFQDAGIEFLDGDAPGVRLHREAQAAE
jgi:transcriptional regulator with XRE-family HTH domain